jgi:hypothetical protein
MLLAIVHGHFPTRPSSESPVLPHLADRVTQKDGVELLSLGGAAPFPC